MQKTLFNFVHKKSVFVGLLFLIVAVYVATAVGFKYFYLFKDNNTVRTYTSLWFCSDVDDPQCEEGVSTLKYRLRTRDKGRASLFGYRDDTHAKVKLQKITFRFNNRSQDLFTTDFFIYEDTNEDGLFEKEKDRKVARGLLKKKRLLFEDLNLVYTYKEILETQSLDEVITLFIVADDSSQTFSHDELKRIEVEAINMERGNEVVENLSSFADKSLYRYRDNIKQSKEDFLKQHPLFIDGEGSVVHLPKGDFSISKTIVIPKGLFVIIDAGVSVKLGKDVSIVSYSPVSIAGTAEAPVYFSRLDAENWGVFAVIGDSMGFGGSALSYATFEGGFETYLNGAFLSGMVSLYRVGDVSIDNCTFSNAGADDSLNVKYSNVVITNSVFENNAADSFDGDFVVGEVFGNRFISSGNDSIDFSGSEVSVFSNYMENSGDKGVSVGEKSTVKIFANEIRNSNIAVQAKDASFVEISGNTFEGNNIGLDAYVKKEIFGEPTVYYYDNVFVNNATAISGLIDEKFLEENILK